MATETKEIVLRFLAPEIHPLPPLVTLQDALIHAARNFCTETGYWVADCDPTEIVAGVADYSLSPETGEPAIVLDVIQVKLDDTALNKIVLADLDAAPGVPSGYLTSFVESGIRLSPVPATAGGVLSVRASFRPPMTTRVLPDILVNDALEFLIHGALARIFRMGGRPWSDLKLAEYHRALFEGSFPEFSSRAANEHSSSRNITVHMNSYW